MSNKSLADLVKEKRKAEIPQEPIETTTIDEIVDTKENEPFIEKHIEEQKKEKQTLANWKPETKLTFDDIGITQDDLWMLYRLKFHKSTRRKRAELLPKFVEVFNRDFKKLKKKYPNIDFHTARMMELI